VLGDATGIEEGRFLELDGVDKVIRISRPYKLVSREFPRRQELSKSGTLKWGRSVVLMEGRARWKMKKQIMTIAHYIHALGIPIMRAGRTNPAHRLQLSGHGHRRYNVAGKSPREFGLKIITEATGLHRHLREDGGREEKNVLENVIEPCRHYPGRGQEMKSYGFLQELALLTKDNKKPVLLKRGESSTIKDFFLAAEYLVANGNPNVMLCLRGIRTFEEEKFSGIPRTSAPLRCLKENRTCRSF